MLIPAVYSLIMGEAGQAPLTMLVDGADYHWASPITPNTVQIETAYGPLPTVAYARWRVCSTVQGPSQAVFRLVSCDDGPYNLVPLAYLYNGNPGASNISNDAVIFTDALNALIAAGVRKNIGWQLAGDNTHPVVIYNVRIEIGWRF